YAANTFQIGFNILLGKVEYINDLPLGILYVQLIGETEPLKLAIEFLAANTADLEVINHGL
ncbi:MAG TPA: methionine ABC transporter ATP-binding protein, partial [Acetobacterium sp.]|nr:methionine ABC transporter ATP-binding protein [Acetobacterium sp.]